MRLFVSGDKEVAVLESALVDAYNHTDTWPERDILARLIERVSLCKALQSNERKGGKTHD